MSSLSEQEHIELQLKLAELGQDGYIRGSVDVCDSLIASFSAISNLGEKTIDVELVIRLINEAKQVCQTPVETQELLD